MKKVLVIGASGMLGKPVTTALQKAGFELTLLARDKEKMSRQFPGLRIVEGDVFNLQSLTDAMNGNEIVYINLSIAQTSKEKDPQPEREGIENIIVAVKQTGIKRIAYLSSLVQFYNGMNGFRWWAFDIKQNAVKAIKDSGISYSIFYPSSFMEIFSNQLRMGNRVLLMSGSVSPMWFIAAADYARQVVDSLTNVKTESKEYVIQGTEAYTLDEAAKIFIDNYGGTKLKIAKAPIGLMKIMGRVSQKINYGVKICEALNLYPEKFESTSTWTELGEPKITLKEFAKSFK